MCRMQTCRRRRWSYWKTTGDGDDRAVACGNVWRTNKTTDGPRSSEDALFCICMTVCMYTNPSSCYLLGVLGQSLPLPLIRTFHDVISIDIGHHFSFNGSTCLLFHILDETEPTVRTLPGQWEYSICPTCHNYCTPEQTIQPYRISHIPSGSILLPPFSFIRRGQTRHGLPNYTLTTNSSYIILFVVMNV
jgi:hypothetical protein